MAFPTGYVRSYVLIIQLIRRYGCPKYGGSNVGIPQSSHQATGNWLPLHNNTILLWGQTALAKAPQSK